MGSIVFEEDFRTSDGSNACDDLDMLKVLCCVVLCCVVFGEMFL